ncbi:MAG: hypothetical protein AUK63_2098 [bacterium P3]|nr:MAG: hypothetical protein AUK63_2098 [bacterium P3]
MKKYYSVFVMLAMMVAALSFTACGDDDDDNADNSGGNVVGTWVADAQKELGIEIEGTSSTHYFQFKADGSMVSVDVNSYDRSVWGEYTPDDEVIVERGTWKTADGKLYMTDSEGTETALFSVSDNKLTLTSTSGIIVKITYTRVSDSTIDKYLK